jgi:hypothetical protein
MNDFRQARKAGMTRCAAARFRFFTWKLKVKSFPSDFRNWWFWRVTMSRLKKRDPKEFKDSIERIREAIESLCMGGSATTLRTVSHDGAKDATAGKTQLIDADKGTARQSSPPQNIRERTVGS